MLYALFTMFLPTTREEMNALGWDRPDVILVTGDSYIDHPLSGAAPTGGPPGGPGSAGK